MSEIHDLIRAIRTLLGPNGEHWIQGDFERDGCYCLAGAYDKEKNSNCSRDRGLGIRESAWSYHRCMEKAAVQLGYVPLDHDGYPRRMIFNLVAWNDHPKRTWAEVNTLLERAEQIANV